MTKVHTENPSMVLNINETAETLRISRSTVKRLIGEGKLSTIRVGRRVLLKREALESFLETGGKTA